MALSVFVFICSSTPQWSFNMMKNLVFGGGSALTGKFASVRPGWILRRRVLVG